MFGNVYHTLGAPYSYPVLGDRNVGSSNEPRSKFVSKLGLPNGLSWSMSSCAMVVNTSAIATLGYQLLTHVKL